jgi:hypothetical protein
LHVLDSDRIAGVRPLQAQAQDRYRGIQFLDNMQRLDLNRCFKLLEELLDKRERWPWRKCTVEEILFLPFNPHLSKLPLFGVYEFNTVSNVL